MAELSLWDTKIFPENPQYLIRGHLGLAEVSCMVPSIIFQHDIKHYDPDLKQYLKIDLYFVHLFQCKRRNSVRNKLLNKPSQWLSFAKY